MDLTQIALLLLAIIAAAIAAPLFSWLRWKANQQKLLARTELDDHVLDALEIGVRNVAGKLRAEIPTDRPLTEEEKRRLRAVAVGEAAEILRTKGIEIGTALSTEAINYLVRYLVDRGNAK